MGWFDTDSKDNPQPAAPPPAVATPQHAPAQPAARGGSTLGERLHFNGTIVADDELVVHGKVEGTIHARHTLRIAGGAEVKALVKGVRVLLEGQMEGDLHASEAAVLGPTARLIGNVEAPSLQIQEGAFFKGSVQMPRAEPPAKVPSPKPEKAAPATKRSGGDAGVPGGDAQPTVSAEASTKAPARQR